MSEKVLKILLSELKKVRIRCKHDGCRMVYEMSIADLADRNLQDCPCCRHPLTIEHSNELACHLDTLAKVIDGVVKQQNVEVEFVLPGDP